MKFATIDLNRIDIQDKTYDIGYRTDTASLEASIKRAGVINPVILLDEFANQYKIIAGFSRIRIAQKLHLVEIPALVYSALEITSKDLFVLRLEHNCPEKNYNHVERGIILHKAEGLFDFDDDEIIGDIFPLIGLDKGQYDLKRYKEIPLYKKKLKDRLASGKIKIETASWLNKYSTEDFESILVYIDELSPSSSNQRLIVEFLDEISLRDGTSIKAVLEEDEFAEILKDENMTSSQRCAKFLKNLRIRRYPLYSEAERYFSELKKKLKLPSGVEFAHSPFFENLEHEIKINVSNPDEFQNILKKMSDIALQKEFFDIFHIDEKIKKGVDR